MAGMFDDLIPQQGEAPAASALSFDDLIPEAPPAAPAPQWAVDPETGRTLMGHPVGKPIQSLRSADPSNPIVQSMGRPIAEGREPGVVTQAAGGLGIDREQQRRIIARQLFPDLPTNEALARVAYAPGGRLFAVDQQGRPFYVDPQRPTTDDLSTLRPGNLARWAATGAGDALPIVGGVAGGAIAAPTSIIAGPAAAGAGAAAGEFVRQGAANLLDPQPPSSMDWRRVATEGTLGAVGQGAGALYNRSVAPNALRLRADETLRLTDPAARNALRSAAADATQEGVTLTPGQASGTRSLLQYEDAALQRPDTADRALAFYRQQGGQMQTAGQRLLDTLSPQADKNLGAQAFREGAGDTVREVRQQANRTAAPSYDAARKAGQVVSPDLAQLADNPAVQQAMQQARQTYRIKYGREAPETPDFNLWDLTKRSLDDLHSGASREGNRTLASAYDDVRATLRERLDDAYPTYGAARSAAMPGQRLAAQLEETATGRTGEAGIDARARATVAPIFEQSNPMYVANARLAFEKAGKMDEWNAGLRSYLQDAFDRASRSQEGLNASMLRRQVWGNVDNREVLRAAMTPQQFIGFERFMRVVENVSRTFPQNSLTAMRGNSGRALEEAASDGVSRGAKVLGTVASPQRTLDVIGTITDKVAGARLQANAGQIVDRLFSPDGIRYLEEMSRVSPNTTRAAAITARFLAQGSGADEQSSRR